MSKLATTAQLEAAAQRAKAYADSVSAANSGANYSIKQAAAADDGYFATYYLSNDDTNEQSGVKINIPKDYLVRSASIQTATEADKPVTGMAIGDKYIDFVVNTVEDNGNTTHIYLAVNDLVGGTYSAGNGISLSESNAFSVVINESSANGLSVSSSGLALALATANTADTVGSAGAMSAADKTKLDGFEAATDAEVTSMLNTIFGSTDSAENAET